MRLKYFLRGLGVGIIFAAIVCLTAYKENTGQELTDAQIIERAKELGMVEEETTVDQLMKEREEKSTSEEAASQSDTTEEITEEITEETTTEQSDSQETDTVSEEDQETTAASTEATTQETDTSSNAGMSVTVEWGTSSYTVCAQLATLGVITDATEFDDYLMEYGYADRIRVGTHPVRMGMTYQELAEAITDSLE
jgi:gas vesicle protein